MESNRLRGTRDTIGFRLEPYATDLPIGAKPNVKAAIDERIKNGRFHDVDELLTKALDALPQNNESSLAPTSRPNLADFLLNSPFAGAELNLERRKAAGFL